MTKCVHEGCSKYPIYGFDIKTHCKTHRQPDMINIQIRKCDHPEGCTTIPSFGFPGRNSQATMCFLHKDIDMENLVLKRKCTQSQCIKSAAFGFRGDKKATKCAEHKEKNMINIVSPKCELCNITPSYGIPGGKSIRCARHKENNMEIIRKQQQHIVSKQRKLCDHLGCITRPSQGFSGEKAIKCFKHREVGMINVVSKRCDLCSKIAAFDTRCKDHQKPNNKQKTKSSSIR